MVVLPPLTPAVPNEDPVALPATLVTVERGSCFDADGGKFIAAESLDTDEGDGVSSPKVGYDAEPDENGDTEEDVDG